MFNAPVPWWGHCAVIHVVFQVKWGPDSRWSFNIPWYQSLGNSLLNSRPVLSFHLSWCAVSIVVQNGCRCITMHTVHIGATLWSWLSWVSPSSLRKAIIYQHESMKCRKCSTRMTKKTRTQNTQLQRYLIRKEPRNSLTAFHISLDHSNILPERWPTLFFWRTVCRLFFQI